jgi:hypothetical protein
MPDSSFQRVAAAAVWQPRVSYLVAALVDRCARALPGAEVQTSSMWARGTRYRHWVLWHTVSNPACASPYPRIINGRAALTASRATLLISAHAGEVLALDALLEVLPGPRVTLNSEDAFLRPGVRRVTTTDQGAVSALKDAVDTLRAGGSVLMMADGHVGSKINVQVGGRSFGLRRGAFAAARLTGTPVQPVIALWKGRSIEFCLGAPIPIGQEAEMAQAFARWLERYLPAV